MACADSEKCAAHGRAAPQGRERGAAMQVVSRSRAAGGRSTLRLCGGRLGYRWAPLPPLPGLPLTRIRAVSRGAGLPADRRFGGSVVCYQRMSPRAASRRPPCCGEVVVLLWKSVNRHRCTDGQHCCPSALSLSVVFIIRFVSALTCGVTVRGGQGAWWLRWRRVNHCFPGTRTSSS